MFEYYSSSEQDSLDSHNSTHFPNYNQIIKNIISFLKKSSIYDVMQQSSSVVVLDKNMSMQDAFLAVENHDTDIFLVFDEKKPQSFAGILTISDFIHFLYRDLWCNMDKRKIKLIQLIEEYDNKYLPEILDIITNTNVTKAKLHINNLEFMEQQSGDAKVKNFLDKPEFKYLKDEDIIEGRKVSVSEAVALNSIDDSAKHEHINTSPSREKLNMIMTKLSSPTINKQSDNIDFIQTKKESMKDNFNINYNKLENNSNANSKKNSQCKKDSLIVNDSENNNINSSVKPVKKLNSGSGLDRSMSKSISAKSGNDKNNNESKIKEFHAKKENTLNKKALEDEFMIHSDQLKMKSMQVDDSFEHDSSVDDKQKSKSETDLPSLPTKTNMNAFKIFDKQEYNKDYISEMIDKTSINSHNIDNDEVPISQNNKDVKLDDEYMNNVMSCLNIVQYLNLAFYRRKFAYKQKNKIFSKLEREEIERALHNHYEMDHDAALKKCIEERQNKHSFPSGIVTVDIEESLFKACEQMFFSYVRHLVVTGDYESSQKPKNDIQGVIDSGHIMRYIFTHFKIEKSMHQWLVSDKSEESLFKKPLSNLNIGLLGDDLIKAVYLDDTVYTAIKMMNKNYLTSIPVYLSKNDPKLIAFIERDDVLMILINPEFLYNPTKKLREFIRFLIKEHNKKKKNHLNMNEINEEDEEEKEIDLTQLHLRDKIKILDEKDSLYTVMDYFGSGIIRGIYLNDSKLYGIVGLSHIFHFFVYKEIYYSVNDEIQTMKTEEFKMMGLDNN